ncbi:MAG: family 43 glycosylhydrolase [Verrucomicrobia bacterium]|nr:family 43 glycosylhydrolase [Verrucomicrobiota bacterium]
MPLPATAKARQLHPAVIEPGLPWLDDRGKHIQAHGGGIIKLDDTWYWFGEDRSRDNDPEKRYVACYSSKNLIHWQFRHQVLALSDPENFGHEWVLERPKVYYHAMTRKFVMYMHIDGRLPGNSSRYSIASVGIATCDTVDGDYRYQRHFRPLGRESRDLGQFIDDDGAAYLIFESRPSHGFYIAALSGDYLDVSREVCFVPAPLEGGAIVNYDGLYYVLGSGLTGWWPNANQYATAKRLEGPWSNFADFAPAHTHTWGSQTTNLIKVVGSTKTTVIYAGDRWRPEEHWDSRYLWMPLEIGDGKLALPEPKPWTIDIESGETSIEEQHQ